MSLLRGAISWSGICDSDIPCIYSLVFVFSEKQITNEHKTLLTKHKPPSKMKEELGLLAIRHISRIFDLDI